MLTFLLSWKLHHHYEELNRTIASVKSLLSVFPFDAEVELNHLAWAMSDYKKTLGEGELVCENYDKTLEALIIKATGKVGFAVHDVYSYLCDPKATLLRLRLC